MGAIMSTKCYDHEATSSSKLEQKVAELEREVEKQREVKIAYKTRMERSQEYVRHCLEIAQQNGFLNLFLHQNQSQTPTTTSITMNQQPSNHSFTSLIDTANLNGWYISPHEIEFLEQIGQGSTANIHKGTWRGLDVAVKCIRQDFFHSNGNALSYFAQELHTLSRQRHPFVLHLMGACFDPPHRAWVVTELLSITLEEWIHGPGKRKPRDPSLRAPPLRERLGRALEIAQAMQYLHAQRPKLIHRDLKPSNVFLDHALHVRVADFGHARFLCDHEMALSGDTGTYVYMAPEVIKCEPYNESCDVYSFGIILNELVTLEYPYIHLDYGPTKIAMEVVESNLRPRRLAEDNKGKVEEMIDEVICSSWNKDPSLRPSFATLTSSLKSILQIHHAPTI